MAQLKDRPRIEDARFYIDLDPTDLMEMLAADECLYDVTMMSSVESLDGWTFHGFIRADRFLLLAREVVRDGVGAILFGSVEKAECDSIVEAASDFWIKSQPQ